VVRAFVVGSYPVPTVRSDGSLRDLPSGVGEEARFRQEKGRQLSRAAFSV